MIKKLFLTLIILCSTTMSLAQEDSIARLQRLILENQPRESVTTTENIIRPVDYDKLRTPQSEVEGAILFLSKLSEENASFVRFFSTYAVPANEREDTVLTLSFVLHSLIGISTDSEAGNAGGYYPLAKRDNGKFKSYRRVPGSDTLWWIDIREFNWTPTSWEVISIGDGYFAEPIVSHDRAGVLRLIAGNAVVRADWFIKHAMSTTDQLDLNKGRDFYTTLLYSLNKSPTNVNEWRAAWGLDIKRARSIGNEFGTLVTKSQTVARRNRFLFGYRTELGYLYETYDVKNQTGKRDYLESLFLNKKPGQPPEISDAGEMFASNILGLQVYALRNSSGKLVSFGDPSVVRHMNDVLGDVRVRVAHSCLDCHASGPIPAENTLAEFILSRANLRTYDKRDSLRLKRNLLSQKFRDSVEDNQLLFARAVKKTNGLGTVENGTLYLRSIVRYAAPVSLEVAAYECGVTSEELKAAILGSKYKFGARLKLLVKTGEHIPREVWESPGRDGIPGAFQQAMIILNGLTVIKDEELVEERIIAYQVKSNWENVPIRAGQNTVATVQSGYRLLTTGRVFDGYWLEVYTQDGEIGYVGLEYVEKIQLTRTQVRSLFSKVGSKTVEKIISSPSN